MSWIVNVYKGKGDALSCGSYRGIVLLDQAMKVLERVIEGRVRKIVKIDSSLDLWQGGARQMLFSLSVRCMRNTWRRRKTNGWLLLI